MNQNIIIRRTNKGYILNVNGVDAVESTTYGDIVAAVKSRAAEYKGHTTVRFD